MDLDIKEMEDELKHQKKNPEKFPNIEAKTKIVGLLKKKLKILKSKYDNDSYDEDEYSQNDNQIQSLENFLKTNSNEGYEGENNNTRNIYEEEENQIGEWNTRVKHQDEQLGEIHKNVGKLKKEAQNAGIGIGKTGNKVKNLNKHTEKIQKSVVTQNQRLKDLLSKMRSNEKICCDILLILILLGLIFTLYSIIKHKF